MIEGKKGIFIASACKESDCFVLRRAFSTEKKAKRAVVYATALGLYFVELNGVRVGDARFMPGWTNYRVRLQVQEYDVTKELRLGENEIRQTVGRGWYSGRFGFGGQGGLYGERSAGWVVLEIEYEDGTHFCVATDESWTAEDSYIVCSNLYDGEVQDFMRERKTYSVDMIPFDKEKLIPQEDEPVRTHEEFKPVREFYTPKGEHVFDFGQNLAGAVRVQIDGKRGQELILSHAEVLDRDGNFYTANLRSAKAQDKYVLAGGEQTLFPEFTFHGYRYVKAEGAEVNAKQLTSVAEYSDLHRTGFLHTSDEKMNRLYENVLWGQRSNFVDIPTDCPQRDERMGWTADANVFSRTAAYNYDVRAFFKKWLADMRTEQGEDGKMPDVVPYVFGERNTAALWADAVTMIPWTMYEMYGDKSFLSENIGAMKKFAAAVDETAENGLVARGFQYGDWLGLDREISAADDCRGATDVYFMANVFRAESLRIIADSARILKDKATEREYREKRRKLLSDMRAEYFSPRGRLVNETQTALVLALRFGIAPEKYRAQLAARLNENVIAHGYHMTTGFAGTPYLLFVLSENGYHETAGKLLLNEEYPGWLYEVNLGATTVWERWNGIDTEGRLNDPGMNSFNHYAYGSVMEFVYRRIAGLDAAKAGFKAVRIAPRPVEGLDRVEANYESVSGKITAGYERSGNVVRYFAHIPKGISGVFELPGEGVVADGCGDFSFERKI